jgi:hypothetical protein
VNLRMKVRDLCPRQQSAGVIVHPPLALASSATDMARVGANLADQIPIVIEQAAYARGIEAQRGETATKIGGSMAKPRKPGAKHAP